MQEINSTHVSFGSSLQKQAEIFESTSWNKNHEGRRIRGHQARRGRRPVTSVLPDVDEGAGGEADPL